MSFKIDVSDISILRITCKHCKTALILPLNANNPPFRCVNCATNFPQTAIKDLMRNLEHIAYMLKHNSNDIAVELHIEGES